MIFVTHALLVGVIYLLLTLYFHKYTDVVNNAVKGAILDVTFLRIYILGIVVTLSVVMLVVTPIIGFLMGISWFTIGVVVLSCLFCVVMGLLMVLSIERLGELIENQREDKEQHKHTNKNYVVYAKWGNYLCMVFLLIVPVSTFVFNNLHIEMQYFMALIFNLLLLYVVYHTAHTSMSHMLQDEQEIREQLEKSEALQKNIPLQKGVAENTTATSGASDAVAK